MWEAPGAMDRRSAERLQDVRRRELLELELVAGVWRMVQSHGPRLQQASQIIS
jgi:hypothetical protein